MRNGKRLSRHPMTPTMDQYKPLHEFRVCNISCFGHGFVNVASNSQNTCRIGRLPSNKPE
jgi:hypothetical protein